MSIRSYFFQVWLTVGILFLISPCLSASQHADLVIHNGTIYTLDPDQPTAEMVAVIAGKIVFAGKADELRNWTGTHTALLDLRGRTLTPGLIESHGHLLQLGYSKLKLDLSRVNNYDELVGIVAQAVKKAPRGAWILGQGWHQSKWDSPPEPIVKGFPVHQALSRVTPENPVFLYHASGHAAFANAKAMQIAGITRSSTFFDGGEIIKGSEGNPTGIFTENAQILIGRHVPETSPQQNRQALKTAIQECLENGLTGFRDAGSGREAIELYREFLQESLLKIRLWVMIDGRDQRLLDEWFAKGPEIGTGNHFLTIRAVKLFADGALGSRGAWLLQEYSDRPGHFGHATLPMEQVHQMALRALKHGFQLCVHAIGDRANREVLNQFEKAFAEMPGAAKDHRFRIEHVQHLSASDIPRLAHLGVIASMQGIHLSSDRPWAIERLGPERIVEGAYVWQKLLASGAMIVNGTDTPVEPVSPIACFYASVTRKTLKGFPPRGYEADQKMTREQALRSYTLDAAYGGFEEGIKGSIAVGKLADFTVFSQDIMKVPEDKILETVVDYTIIGGKIAYQRSTFQPD